MTRKHALEGLMLALFITLICFPSSVLAKAEASFEEKLDLDKDGKVYLKNISGDISIKVWRRNEVRVKARKVARRKKDLDDVTIDISKTNGSVRIITNYPDDGPFGSTNVSVHYELSLPEKASVEVETVSGDTDAKDIGGQFGITTVSGDLKVVGVGEGIRVKSVSGDLKIVNSGGGLRIKSVSGEVHLRTIVGEADVKTVSGDITIHDIQGSLEVGSVSGEIELEGVMKARDVEVKSVQGSLVHEGKLEERGRYTFTTHSGEVHMKLPKGSHFELDAETRSGEVECDFDLKRSDKKSDKEIQGVVGKGGASLNISSFSGDIEIRRK